VEKESSTQLIVWRKLKRFVDTAKCTCRKSRQK